MPRWLVTPLQTIVSLFLFVEVAVVAGLALFPAVSLFQWVEPQLALGCFVPGLSPIWGGVRGELAVVG